MAGNQHAIIEERDIKILVKLFLKNWYIIAVLLILALIYSRFYIHKATKIYSASSTILLQANQNFGLKDAILQGLGVDPVYENIDNEMQVIASLPVIEATLSRLDLSVSYFIEGRVRVTEYYENIPFKVRGEPKKSIHYESAFRINIVDTSKFRLRVEELAYDKEHYFGEPIENSEFAITITKDPSAFNKFMKQSGGIPSETNYLFVFNRHSDLVRKYKGALGVTKFEWPAAYIAISATDEIPDRAIDFLDTLSAVYLDRSVQTLKDINNNALEFINEQLNEVVDELNNIELSLEEYKKEKITISVKDEQDWYLKRLTELEVERSRLTIQIKSLDFLADLMLEKETVLSPDIINSEYGDVYLREQLKDLGLLLRKREEALSRHTKESAVYKDISNEISSMRTEIVKQIDVNKAAMVNRLDLLGDQIGKYRALARQIPQKERELINIQRKLSINEEIYIYLLQKRSETLIAKAGIVSDKAILEPAQSAGLVSPNANRVYMTNIGLALALALIIVFIRQTFYNTIDTKEELADLSDIPILGVIGAIKSEKADYFHTDTNPKSNITEAFRGVRNNFDYMAVHAKSKVILVTSCLSGEGKTFCSISLATLLAKAGKKVIIVGLDLHKPMLGEAFGSAQKEGLTTHIIGKDKLEDIIEPTQVENLDLMPAGPIPYSASEMILDPEMGTIIDKLKARYDYVVLDTPPVGILSDAVALMKYADINIYIVKANYAKKNFVHTAEEIRTKNNPKNFCFILNGVKSKFYSYGYGYGKSYGDNKYTDGN